MFKKRGVKIVKSCVARLLGMLVLGMIYNAANSRECEGPKNNNRVFLQLSEERVEGMMCGVSMEW